MAGASIGNAAFVASGGIASYFLSRFPVLVVAVWESVGAAQWGSRPEFKQYLPGPAEGGASETE